MEEFPSNSHLPKTAAPKPEKAAQPEPKKIEKVTEGEVVRRKKPLGRRLKETFVGGDAKSVWGYVMLDVLIPAAKDMISDAGSQFLERMLFGESRSHSRRSSSRPSGINGYVSYNRYAQSTPYRREDPREYQMSRRARATHDFDEIILATRQEADMVIERLGDLIEKYGTASVADLYELVGVSGNYTDDKWGWTTIRGANPIRTRSGYLLDLPQPEPLND